MSLQDDRRGTTGQRVPFEALVVVANPKGGNGAYECEAMDVSEHGMHLRTAYLPDIGQALTFRFEGGAGEVVADGNVLWRDEQAKGGEFGVRFTKMSAESLSALQELCGIEENAAAEASGEAAKDAPIRSAKGSRVRLHIEGLGSPMRARVRDSQTSEVMVGSNLEFLKVGKQLDLEDVEAGKKRAAYIDRVDVEVDKETKIPQLVVTLRYDAVSSSSGPMTETSRSLSSKSELKAAEQADASEETSEDEDGPKKGAFDGVANAARGIAGQVGPRLASFGKTATGAFSSLVDKARTKRVAEGEEPARRVTAAAPDGALRASGRKVVRGESEETMEENETFEKDESDAKSRRRAKVIGIAGAGLMLTLLAFFAIHAKSSAPPGAEASAIASNEVTTPVAALPKAPGFPGAMNSADAVSANVPLFGTTPLSTTEPALAASGAPPVPAAAALPPPSDGEGDDDKDAKGSTTYGKGKVAHAKIVRLKMDAPITDLRGVSNGNSVTISLPGRRNVESATNLPKKDKRLASVKAVPKDGGVDVTFTFKDAVPPFLAKASGKMLEMDLGEPKSDDADDEGTTKKHKKKHAVASKDATDKKHKKGKKKHSDD